MILEISPERAYEIIDKIADFIVKRRMAAAAIMTIESLRPLNYIGSQLMYFLAPFAEIIFNPKEYQEFAVLLEKDEYIKLLMERIDELDEELYREERAEKRKISKRRLNRFKKFLGIKIKQDEKNIKN